ncbi:MAG: hypothetical protein MI923_16260 [Phycisphaerales bacterium]|nr:hypothetical protein [Phycisphaerales bacterium]
MSSTNNDTIRNLDFDNLPENVPEIAYIGGDLCIVRTMEKTRELPITVTFAFTPMTGQDSLDLPTKFSEARKIGRDQPCPACSDRNGSPFQDCAVCLGTGFVDPPERIKAQTRQTMQSVVDHLRAWTLKGAEDKTWPFDSVEAITKAPNRLLQFIIRCIRESGQLVEDAEKKSPGSSGSPPGTEDGQASNVATASDTGSRATENSRAMRVEN